MEQIRSKASHYSKYLPPYPFEKDTEAFLWSSYTIQVSLSSVQVDKYILEVSLSSVQMDMDMLKGVFISFSTVFVFGSEG